MRLEYILLPTGIAWLGFSLGVIPFYITAGILVLSGIVCAREAANLFGGDYDGSIMNATTGIRVNNFEQTTSAWIQSVYRAAPKVEIASNWNCKNCGGPNIEQIKCQYCGMIKE